MSREMINEICAAFPGAEASDPWGDGHDAWKVGDKMFACIGSQGVGVAVKCPDVETADMLKDAGVAERAPYFHKSWVLLRFDGLDRGEAEHRLAVSYDTIRAGLTKKVQATLDPRV